MLKKFYFFTLALLISISSFSQSGTGALKGTITDEKTGETIPFAAVVVKTGETQVAGTATDINGVYTIKPLTPGTYNVLVSVVGYNSIIIAGVLINSDKITFKDIGLKSGIQLDEIEIVEYTVPLINRDGGASGGTVTGKEIEKCLCEILRRLHQQLPGYQIHHKGFLFGVVDPDHPIIISMG